MIDTAAFQAWLERGHEASDTVSATLTARLAALLDRAPADWSAGAELPPQWYVQLFGPLAPQSALAADGHPPKGDLLPPIPLPRRMFAGRRVEFLGELRVGDVVSRQSRVTDITPKQGKSGPMCFVTLRHELSTARGLALVEEQDVVYREAAGEGARPAPSMPAEPVPVAAHRKTLTPDPTMLFRYSAVTFNAHRIHYDLPYATGEEGYPGLVVNGGLSTLLLWDLASARLGRRLRRSATRNLRPLFEGRPLSLALSEPDAQGRLDAWIEDDTGAMALRAELELA